MPRERPGNARGTVPTDKRRAAGRHRGVIQRLDHADFGVSP